MFLPHAWHGAGPPLLLISGLGAKGTSWQPFLDSATARFRVLTFDQRGSGRAPTAVPGHTIADMARDALELLEVLGIERIAVMGRSMGGMVAQELALLAPERVTRLVLACSTGRVDRHLAAVFELWARMAEEGVPAALRHRSSMLWCLGSRALESPGRAQAYLDARIKTDRPADYAIQARACAAHDALDRLATLPHPTLVISGDDDRLTPPAHAHALARTIPNAQLLSIPGAGHLAYLEEPDRFQSAALGFLEGGPCPSTTTPS